MIPCTAFYFGLSYILDKIKNLKEVISIAFAKCSKKRKKCNKNHDIINSINNDTIDYEIKYWRYLA